jgi:large conductance mechanosensitive channel
MKKTWQEFLTFIMSGNVLMLAVAFVLGGLTKLVIDGFVHDIVNPIIGAIVGKPSFTNTLKIGRGVILWGDFVTLLINLVVTGAVLFLIVKGYDTYRSRKKAAGEEVEEPSEDTLLLREIRDALVTRS